MLAVEDIHTYYGNSYVLQGISLQVKEGEVIGMIGRMAWARQLSSGRFFVSIHQSVGKCSSEINH